MIHGGNKATRVWNFDPKKEHIIAEERIIIDPKKEDIITEDIVADPEWTFPPIRPLPKALADFKSKARSEGNLGEYWGIFWPHGIQ